MNTRMPSFQWSDADKQEIVAGASVVEYWELGVERVTFLQPGVFCPHDAVPKVFVSPGKYVPLAHCVPRTIAVCGE